jgi:hypothetical protein
MAHEIVIYGPRAATENSIVDLKVLDSGHPKHTTNSLDFQTFYKKISAFHGHDFYPPSLFIVLSISFFEIAFITDKMRLIFGQVD